MALIKFHRGSSTGRVKRREFCCQSKLLTASPACPICVDRVLGWKRGHVLEYQVQVRRMQRLEKPLVGLKRGAGLRKLNRWRRREEEITVQSPRQIESALI